MQRKKLIQLLLSAVPAMFLFPLSGKAKQKYIPATGGFKVGTGKDRFNEEMLFGKENGMKCKVSGKDTNELWYVVEENDTNGVAPPLHVHTSQDELFFVTKGKYIIKVGDEVFHLSPGDCVFAPRNIPHTFLSIGEDPHQMILTYQPAGKMEKFFHEMRDPSYKTGKSLEQCFEEHDMKIVGWWSPAETEKNSL
jgi:mannose-6-phosphate isomerase-like protein (cupin superfamily)